jgi:hypothetical protein
MALVGVLIELRQPKAFLIKEIVQGDSPCISAARDAGEMPLSTYILILFASPGDPSGEKRQSCAMRRIINTRREINSLLETLTLASSSAHILQQMTRVTCAESRYACADRRMT